MYYLNIASRRVNIQKRFQIHCFPFSVRYLTSSRILNLVSGLAPRPDIRSSLLDSPCLETKELEGGRKEEGRKEGAPTQEYIKQSPNNVAHSPLHHEANNRFKCKYKTNTNTSENTIYFGLKPF